MTHEQRAFLDAQPTYDNALEKAESAGGAPATLNALISPDAAQVSSITLRPLTLGGYMLLQALDNPWLRDGQVSAKDNAVVVLALTEPEWIRGNVCYRDDLSIYVDARALADKLGAIAHATPAWAVPRIIQHLLHQMQAMSGHRAEPEDASPLVLTPASLTRPAATAAAATAPATPAGSH